MSDYQNLVARLRKMPTRVQIGGSYERDCFDAATAIETLLRERDEAREAEIEAKEHEAITATFLETCTQQRDAAIARAEKAEAELAENELARDAVLCELGRDLNAAETDRAALRALLREVRTMMSWLMLEAMDEVVPETMPVEYRRAIDAIARIDAALKGGESHE